MKIKIKTDKYKILKKNEITYLQIHYGPRLKSDSLIFV